MTDGEPPAVAVVGMACRYPDAADPEQLWDNVLSRRRSFRRLPPERLDLADYGAADASAPDRTYVRNAAVLEGYEFDRVAFRVAGSTFRSADLTHWLALDVASRALDDAGHPRGEGLSPATTGVVVGNTLTGEFSRAGLMRLRWPYVRRAVDASLAEDGWPAERRAALLATLEQRYKEPFPPIGAESLAGGLSNTIAGRICNHFDLHGGGYTVDAACASSLLAVTTACTHLWTGDLDVAIAGGVDLSLDPFELVGFAKTGALARDSMRVYDRRSGGFWPGEGCGFVVLVRLEDARRRDLPVRAVIRGWGVSSDGRGEITRPEPAGQRLALERAYRRAGFGPETVGLFEGHGTGTAVGDQAELETLDGWRRAGGAAQPAALGSIKANIGHTKAAAGAAGLIKACMAVADRVLPPTTGCPDPQPPLLAPGRMLRVLEAPEPWPGGQPPRAGVNAMGFGGINTHVIVEGTGSPSGRRSLGARHRTLARRHQDAEVLLLSAPSRGDLLERVARVRQAAEGASLAEVAELAAAVSAPARGGARAAVVTSTPETLVEQLDRLAERLGAHSAGFVDARGGIAFGEPRGDPRVVYLFSGQASPVRTDGGAWARRFPAVARLYDGPALPEVERAEDTRLAQPAVVRASLAGLAVLEDLGFEAAAAVGHSVGELTALHWAGSLPASELERLAHLRGEAVARGSDPAGAMAGLAASVTEAQRLCGDRDLWVAAVNGAQQTVVSGATAEIAALLERASDAGVAAQRLAVSHAFHSPLVAGARPLLSEALVTVALRPPEHTVWSTVTGEALDAGADLTAHLCDQLTQPVRFAQALAGAARGADLVVEVGPGRVLARLAGSQLDVPVVSVDASGSALRGLLTACAAAHCLGAELDPAVLFDGRGLRRFDLEAPPRRFLANPCEHGAAGEPGWEPAPELEAATERETGAATAAPGRAEGAGAGPDGLSVLDRTRAAVAARVELPVEHVLEQDRLLADLHLSSITVAQLAADLSPAGGPPPVSAAELAGATVGELARLVEDRAGDTLARPEGPPAGAASWVRAFVTRHEPAPGPDPAGRPVAYSVAGEGGDPTLEALARVQPPQEGASTVVVSVPGHPGPEAWDLLRTAVLGLAARGGGHLVVVQSGWSAASVARTAHLEHPEVQTTVVTLPEPGALAPRVLAEAAAPGGHREVVYSPGGERLEPVLALWDPPGEDRLPLGQGDVLLASGGARGIGALAARHLARSSGARLALLGRADPATDEEVRRTLALLEADGVEHRYLQADVTDGEGVRAALASLPAGWGPVTALLHAAGRNEPALLADVDAERFEQTRAPKVAGLRNLLAALDAGRLRLLVTFGSIIGRAGLHGESDYALANELMAQQVEAFGRAHPGCRAVDLAWSVWDGVGMGPRLGRVDQLAAEGVDAIPPEEGVRMLERVLASASPPPQVIVSGRFGQPPTVALEPADLPLHRWVERVLVHYPRVEAVVESEVSLATDPYVADHAIDGVKLLPGVMGLEAMAQVAGGLLGRTDTAAFADVEFVRPVTVPERGTRRVRVAAYAPGAARCTVTVRSDETGFEEEHFRAVVEFGPPEAAASREPAAAATAPAAASPAAAGGPGDLGEPAWPAGELYGATFFHGPAFERVAGFHLLHADGCLADVRVDPGAGWFGSPLPAELLLGDPAARDAALHAVQACVPQQRLVPVRVERIVRHAAVASPLLRTRAVRVSEDGTSFVYDIRVYDPAGNLVEHWQNVTLHATGALEPPRWPQPTVGPYLERELEARGLAGVRVATAALGAHPPDQALAEAATDRLRRSLLKPNGDGPAREPGDVPWHLASAGDGAGALAVAATAPVACAVENGSRAQEPAGDPPGGEAGGLARALCRQHGLAPPRAAAVAAVAEACLAEAGLEPGAALPPGNLDGRWLWCGSREARALLWLGGSEHDPVVGLSVRGSSSAP